MKTFENKKMNDAMDYVDILMACLRHVDPRQGASTALVLDRCLVQDIIKGEKRESYEFEDSVWAHAMAAVNSMSWGLIDENVRGFIMYCKGIK